MAALFQIYPQFLFMIIVKCLLQLLVTAVSKIMQALWTMRGKILPDGQNVYAHRCLLVYNKNCIQSEIQVSISM
jgi:hypothetical protein